MENEMTTDTHATHADSHSEHHGIGHVIPVPVLIAVFLALIVLTVVTVAASYLPLGDLEIWVAMSIATVKAALVAAYFMHLRYDNPLNAVLFMIGLLFVGLFVGFVLMDAEQYRSDLIEIPAVRGN
jgi:cytochrome c oxidase subunit IV